MSGLHVRLLPSAHGGVFDALGGNAGEEGDECLQEGPADEGGGSADGEDGIDIAAPVEPSQDHGGKEDSRETAGDEFNGEVTDAGEFKEADAKHGTAEAACDANETHSGIVHDANGFGGIWCGHDGSGGGCEHADGSGDDEGDGGFGSGHSVGCFRV